MTLVPSPGFEAFSDRVIKEYSESVRLNAMRYRHYLANGSMDAGQYLRLHMSYAVQ
jgi:hypothetical protein